MRTTKASKQSSNRRFKVTVPKPEDCEPWKEWKPVEVQELEWNGHKFKAAFPEIGTDYLYLGDNLSVEDVQIDDYERDAWGYHRRPLKMIKIKRRGLKNYILTISTQMLSAGSCAYNRVQPLGKAHGGADVAYMWDWYINHRTVDRGCIAYLTHLDGDIGKLGEILMHRGFNLVSVNPSIHTGNYPVYLFVHPGDAFYNKNKNRKVILDADLLGASIAGDAFPRNPWNKEASDTKTGPVQTVAPSIPEAGLGQQAGLFVPDRAAPEFAPVWVRAQA
jgi:hypothetical protein